MATNKFYIFDENKTNMLTDTNYYSDAQRLGGVATGQARSILHNKLFYQTSLMAYAWGQVIADSGVSIDDSSPANLVTALNNILSSKFVKGTATLPTSGWTANTGDYTYKYSLAIAGVQTTDVADVSIDKDSLDTAQDCELSSTCETYTGGITFFAKTVPASAIPISYIIFK